MGVLHPYFIGALTPPRLNPILHLVRRFSALLLAGLYLGLSNYCLSYAIVTGQPHHGVVSTGEASHHPKEHGQEHDAHHDQAPSHDHEGASDACCAAYNSPGLIVPAAPQLLARSDSAILPAFFLSSAALSTAVEPCFSRRDHGPPVVASQDAAPSCRAPRAPPILA